MLIAEDLLLLVTDDDSGKLCAPAPQVDVALAGANLVQLTLLNKLDLSPDAPDSEPGRLVLRDDTPTGDDILDTALRELTALEGRKPEAALRALSRDLRSQVYGRLAARGLVRAHQHKILGVVARHTWPAADARREAEVRRSITDTLRQTAKPDSHTAALIALIHALRCDHKVLDVGGLELSKEELKARVEEVASGNWASEAVRKTINAMLAAVIAATTAATSTVVLPGGG